MIGAATYLTPEGQACVTPGSANGALIIQLGTAARLLPVTQVRSRRESARQLLELAACDQPDH